MYMRGLQDIFDMFTDADFSSEAVPDLPMQTFDIPMDVNLPPIDVSSFDTSFSIGQQVSNSIPDAGINWGALLNTGLSTYGAITAIRSGGNVTPTGQIIRPGTAYPQRVSTVPRSSPFLGTGAAGSIMGISPTVLALGAVGIAALVLLRK